MKAIIRLNVDVELVRDLAAHGYEFKYSGNRVIEVFNCDADHINKFIRENGYDLDAFTVSQVRESSDSKNQQLVDKLAELHKVMGVGREIHGTVASVDTNICTWEEEYSVIYVKNNKIWTIIGVPASNIKFV